MNASDDRGIGIVREQILNFAQTRTLHAEENGRKNIKLIILDEADAMTKDAQNALRFEVLNDYLIIFNKDTILTMIVNK